MTNKNASTLIPDYLNPLLTCRAIAWSLCLLLSAVPMARANTCALLKAARTNLIPMSRTQDAADVQMLELGSPVERELAGGQTHSYQLTLAAGQYAHLVIEQKGVDVVIRLLGTDGKPIANLDNSNGIKGRESVYWIAETTALYRLEVGASGKDAARGRYEIRIAELREPSGQDKDRAAAQKAFIEAKQLRSQGVKSSLEAALKKFEEALALYRKTEDRDAEAGVLIWMGGIYSTLGDKQKSLEYSNKALLLRRASGDRGGEAIALNNIGRAYEILGESRKALEQYAQALPLTQEVKDTGTEATVHNNMALALETLGELQRALDHYNQSLPLYRARGNRRGEAAALLNMGAVYATQGELQKALEHYNQARSVLREAGEKRGEAFTLNNIGNVYRTLGEMQKALEYLNQAVSVMQEVGDQQSEAGVTNNIGTVYQMLGELDKALEYRSRALLLFRAMKNRYEEANTLQDIGTVYSDMGEIQKALDYYNQALPLLQSADDKKQVALALNNIGTAYRELGQPQKALEYYNQSLTLRRTLGDRIGEAATLNNLGHLYRAQGEAQRSLESHSQALTLAQATGDRRTEASALKNLALLKRDKGNLTEARSHIERAISLLEFIRARAGDQENRTSFLATVSDYHEFYIDLLMRMHAADPQAGHDWTALAISEQARARSLLELLAEAHTDIREGVEAKLLERERNLKQRITTSLDNLANLLNGKHSEEQSGAAVRAINALTDEYRQVQAEIHKRSPRYAALTQPQPLNVREIQQQMLDSDTILLEFALGRERSYLWAVTNNQVQSYQLPSRSEIEAQAKSVYQLLIARQPAPLLTPAQQQAREQAADAQYLAQASALSRMLLGQVAAQLGTKRLLIVADGALQYLPFAALPAPLQETEAGGRRRGNEATSNSSNDIRSIQTKVPRAGFTPLIYAHEIVSLPSASVLAVLRRELAGRRPAAKIVAVIADPVFSQDDARVKLSLASGNSPGSAQRQPATVTSPALVSTPALKSAIRNVRGVDDVAGLRRLLFSRDEAEAILAATQQPSVLKALDFQANRALVMSDELGQYRVVHFSTHGLLDSLHPELSGLVLSLVDKTGEAQEGFLRLHEIYNLRLNADLVVLSACQTGLGEEVRGEGLIGLTRGFMYAGAKRVVASLWQVDDAATAELMKRFYRGMMQEKLPPSAALRAAQIEMLKKKHWQSPYYWGAFVLQGEWR